MIQPLMLMLVFTVFFGVLVQVESEGIPYAVFVMIGLTLWQVVGKILNEGSLSVVTNGGLVNKIYFPRAYFPIASAAGSLVDLAFGLLALAVLLVVFGMVPGWHVLLLPVFAGIAMTAVLGVAFWLSSLNVAYRDVAQLLPFLTQLWMFMSPVIYSASIIPAEFRPLYWLNPLVLAIDGMRWSIAGTAAPPAQEWLEGTAVALALLISGYVYFRRREPWFSDVV